MKKPKSFAELTEELTKLLNSHAQEAIKEGASELLKEVGLTLDSRVEAFSRAGKVKSPRKTKAARENGKLGGRPPKPGTRIRTYIASETKGLIPTCLACGEQLRANHSFKKWGHTHRECAAHKTMESK